MTSIALTISAPTDERPSVQLLRMVELRGSVAAVRWPMIRATSQIRAVQSSLTETMRWPSAEMAGADV
jgi:hypothetical protein